MIKVWTIDDAPLVGNHPALDLTNTAAWSNGVPTNDRLVDFAALVRWAVRLGLITSKQAAALQRSSAAHPSQAVRTLQRARRFRQALHDVFAAQVSGGSVPSEALDKLNNHIAAALGHTQIRKRAGAFAWTWDAPDAFESLLWPVAQCTAELLTNAERLARVRLCAGDNCGWLFLDNSKRGARRWCRMSECGNRAKVRRFRQRRG
jgi:predicted RNA-binding Zn ribbon-like protein